LTDDTRQVQSANLHNISSTVLWYRTISRYSPVTCHCSRNEHDRVGLFLTARDVCLTQSASLGSNWGLQTKGLPLIQLTVYLKQTSAYLNLQVTSLSVKQCCQLDLLRNCTRQSHQQLTTALKSGYQLQTHFLIPCQAISMAAS